MSNIFQKIREKEEISPVGSKIFPLKRPASGKSNRLSKAGQPSVPAKEKAVPLEWKRLSRLKHPLCYRPMISIPSQHLHLTRQSKYSGRRYYNQDNMLPGHRDNCLHKIKTNLSSPASSPGNSHPPSFARKNQHYFKQNLRHCRNSLFLKIFNA